MMECGALSITGIQAIAASKIQAVYRGYRVRKTFLERKKLLMKHEQLRKDAARQVFLAENLLKLCVITVFAREVAQFVSC